MIKETYVSYEVAKLLKENGFKEITQAYINTDKEVYMLPFGQGVYELTAKQFPYPTHQMAMAWLKDEYKLILLVGYDRICDKFYSTIRKRRTDYFIVVSSQCEEPEEAIEKGLKYTLENLI